MKPDRSLPSVSVIVPAHNRAAIIGETLETLLGQTHAPHELIVVDDGSTDATADVARSFGPRVTVVEQANAGPGAARNRGLAMATGEFIQFFDSDDLCTHDKLELQARALATSGAALAYGPWVHAFIDSASLRLGPVAGQQGPVAGDPVAAMLRGWLAFLPACLVRRSVVQQVGGYPEACRTGEDLELLFRLLLAGVRMVHVPQALLLVRQHPEGQISGASHLAHDRARDMVHLVSTVRHLLASSGRPMTATYRRELAQWHWRATRDLAAHDGTVRVPFSPVEVATHKVRQWQSGLRQRLVGSRLPPDFAPAPLTAQQQAAVAALGYRMLGCDTPSE